MESVLGGVVMMMVGGGMESEEGLVWKVAGGCAG